MLLEWRKKNMHHIAFRPVGEGYSVNNVKEIHLQFGLNVVDDALWNECKAANKSVVSYLKGEKAALKERGSEDLSKREEEKAVSLVKECFVLPVLKAWAKDSRLSVSEAAQEQIAEINDALHGGKSKAQAEA